MRKMNVCLAVLAVYAGVAGAQTYADCQLLNGYVPVTVKNLDGTYQPASAPDGGFVGTYRAVLDAADPSLWGNVPQYTSHNSVQCTVKEVQVSTKAKPNVKNVNYGVMNSEECSFIASTSSVWSKLGQLKYSEAQTVNDGIISKADSLYLTGKLTAAARDSIQAKARLTGICIAPLVTP